MGQQDTQKQLMVFLSHASEDKRQVRNLHKRLKDGGFDPWLSIENLSLAGTVGISWKNKER